MNNSDKKKGRIQLTDQEIQAMRALVQDKLKGEVRSKPSDETLGGLLIKLARASKRINA